MVMVPRAEGLQPSLQPSPFFLTAPVETGLEGAENKQPGQGSTCTHAGKFSGDVHTGKKVQKC